VVRDLRLDHAGLAWLQNALRCGGFDAVAQLAFKDMDQRPSADFKLDAV